MMYSYKTRGRKPVSTTVDDPHSFKPISEALEVQFHRELQSQRPRSCLT
jgi:hypothetical protein